MGVEILRDGEVNVARPDAEYLLSIRRGEVSLDQVIAEHDALYEMLRELRDTSGLPDGPDYGRINAVVVRITEAAVQDRGGGLGVEIDEERRVAEALAMIKKVRIPDSQLEQLGMDEDWADTVSPEFVRCVINVADRRKALLKKLSAE